jgi:phytoene synthase
MRAQDRPFYLDPWKGDHMEAARSIWDWHLAIHEAALNSSGRRVDFEVEAKMVRSDLSSSVIDDELTARIRATALAFGMDADDFVRQVVAAERYAGPIRFADFGELREFVDSWIGPVARQLAAIAGLSGFLHARSVAALGEGFFLLGVLLDLPQDLARDHVFIPGDELRAFAVSDEQLKGCPPDDQVRKLVWKQCVRIRDSFATALPLSQDLPRRYSVGFRRWWLGGLEIIHAIERRNFDVCSAPVQLSLYHRAQARFQARFARVSFGHK